ncbi:MAG: peptidylprolyl isomerase [Chloroflexi bacterium]|nr:peptidylprolyl isomerase [Chloroflexota bacterium]
MSVATGRVVAITYTLSTNDTVRHVRSELWGDRPFEYLHGAGNIIPGLERALEGRLPGDHFSISIPPAEAYGERDRALQQRVPVDLLGGMDRLQPGMRFMATSEDGAHAETLLLTDVEEDEQMAVLDANHPLAGMTLQFEVSVVAVREATDEERARGRIISDESTDDAQAGAGALNIAPLVAVATQGQGG